MSGNGAHLVLPDHEAAAFNAKKQQEAIARAKAEQLHLLCTATVFAELVGVEYAIAIQAARDEAHAVGQPMEDFKVELGRPIQLALQAANALLASVVQSTQDQSNGH